MLRADPSWGQSAWSPEIAAAHAARQAPAAPVEPDYFAEFIAADPLTREVGAEVGQAHIRDGIAASRKRAAERRALATLDRLHSGSNALERLHNYEAHRGHSCCLDPNTSRRFTLVGVREGSRRATVVPARCRTYGCPCCTVRNIRRNRARAAMGLAEMPVAAFVTGTIDPKEKLWREYLEAHAHQLDGLGAEDTQLAVKRLSVRYLGRGWNQYVTYLRRYEPAHVCEDCGKAVGGFPRQGRHERGCGAVARCKGSCGPEGCPTGRHPYADAGFFKAMELQRNGRAHVHVALRFRDLASFQRFQTAVAPGGPLHAMAIACGFGGGRKWRDYRGRLRSGFEAERVRSPRELAAYLSKIAGSYYGPATGPIAGELVKDRQQRVLPPYTRRASWSMGGRTWAKKWHVPLRDLSIAWSFSAVAPERVAAFAVSRGFVVSVGAVPNAPGTPAVPARAEVAS